MGLGAAFIALLLAADAGAGRDAGPTTARDVCQILGPRPRATIDIPAVEAALARGCAIDAIRAGTIPLLTWSVVNEPKLTPWLLAHGASPAVRDPHTGSTALHWLALDDAEDINLFNLLVRHGADVNAVTNGGTTPLHDATQQRQCVQKRGCNCYEEESKLPPCKWQSRRRMMRALLAHGADPNKRDAFGTSPLTMLLGSNLIDEMTILLKAGARPVGLDGNQETIWNIMQVLDPRVVRLLLAHGADPNERDGDGETALHALAVHWDYDREGTPSEQRRFMAIARMLLARGADARAVSNHGETPLHPAAVSGLTPLARAYIAAGAPVDAADKQGRTPLHLASWLGHAELAALLLERGADARRKDTAGLTPLHWLARGHHHSYPLEPRWNRTVRLLVRRGGRLDERDSAGRTPLLHAASDAAIARLLVANGGAAANAGPRGASPLHIAVFHDSEQLVGALIAAGTNVEARDADGRTPLHWAAFMGRERALAALAATPGIDLEAVDRAGHTALWWAVEACQTKAAELLRARGARASAADGTRKNPACAGPKEPPLHAAARTINMKQAQALVTAGADINARDEQGRTALHVAQTYAIGVPFDLYKLLIDKGAASAARDAMGRTPLHAVYDTNEGAAHVRFGELLVCRGADPTARDLFGWTPIDLALLRGWRTAAAPACNSGASGAAPAPR